MTKKLLFLLLLSVGASPMVQAQTIRYVKPTAAGTGSGASWANASGDLQAMINASASGNQVWVAAGTYKPTSTTARNVSFAMRNGVAIYGGFVGSETSLSQRPGVNPITGSPGSGQPSSTTLSGDIGTVGDNSDNSYHVIVNGNLNNTAVLDGVVITGGNADGSSYPNDLGGAMYNNGSSGGTSSPTLTNCSFLNNTAYSGGAMFNDGYSGTSSPTLTNCSFQTNTADTGGAMYNNGSSGGTSRPMLTNCSFQTNSAIYDGGAMYNDGRSGTSSPTLTNCSFQTNSATNNGGAMYNDGFSGTSRPTLTNCSFQNNSAYSGGAMYNNGEGGNSSPMLTNCSFQTNSATNNGGAMYNDGYQGTSSPTLTNCSFQTNNSAYSGGAMYNDGRDFGTSSPSLTNCSFQTNTADTGGAMYNDGSIDGTSSPTLTNCVLFGNGGGNTIFNDFASVSASYSLFEKDETDFTGSNNITGVTISPFASAASTQLSASSLAINAGNPASVTVADPPYTATALPATDLAGNPRIVGGRVDMGAFEYGAPVCDGSVFVSVKSGNWNDPTVWSCGTLPTAGSVVNLKHVVSIPGVYTALGGTVRYDVGGKIIYQTGGRLVLGP